MDVAAATWKDGHLVVGKDGHLVVGRDGHLVVGRDGHLVVGKGGHLVVGKGGHLVGKEGAVEAHNGKEEEGGRMVRSSYASASLDGAVAADVAMMVAEEPWNEDSPEDVHVVDAAEVSLDAAESVAVVAFLVPFQVLAS